MGCSPNQRFEGTGGMKTGQRKGKQNKKSTRKSAPTCPILRSGRTRGLSSHEGVASWGVSINSSLFTVPYDWRSDPILPSKKKKKKGKRSDLLITMSKRNEIMPFFHGRNFLPVVWNQISYHLCFFCADLDSFLFFFCSKKLWKRTPPPSTPGSSSIPTSSH